MRIDRMKLRAHIHETIAKIKSLKEKRHESGQPNYGWRQMRDLDVLKDLATRQYALMAGSRNRIHLSNWQPAEGPRRPMTKEEQTKMYDYILKDYLLPEPAVVAEPAALTG